MTEIKFRAYDKKLCILIEESEMTSLTKEFGVRTTLTGILNNPDYIIDVAYCKNKLGQWVFNNDIIKGKGFRRRRQVVFDHMGYSLKGFNPYFFDHSIINNCTVLGNIHQNPELLSY